ncbi:YgaP family membrane protein [Nocardia sp. NPDC055029]
MANLPRHQGWSIERLVPLLAGAFVLISVLLAVTFSQWWLIFTGFVGANLLFYSAVGWCPATLLLRRAGVPATSASCPTLRAQADPEIARREFATGMQAAIQRSERLAIGDS